MCCSTRRLLLQDAQTATFFFLPLLLLPLSVFCYFAPLETFPHSHRNTIIWNPFPSLETSKTPAAAADTYRIVHTHHPQGTPGHKRRARIPEHRDPQSTPPICCNDPSGNGSRKVIQGVFEGIGGGYSTCKHIGIRVSKRLWWSLLTNETIIWPCSPFLSVPGSVDWLQLGWCIGSSPHPYLQGTHCTKCCHDVQISSPCHVMLATSSSSSSSSSHLERKIAFESVFASWLPPILCFVANPPSLLGFVIVNIHLW